MVSFSILSSIELSSAYFFDHIYAHKVVNSTPISSRNTLYANTKRSLTTCEEKLLHPNAMKRRQDKRDGFINGHKKKKRARDTGYPPLISKRADNASSLFEDVSCILSPEVTIGPYYVEGEYVIDYITEDQDGVVLLLDVQIIDVNTCEPVSKSYIDVWHVTLLVYTLVFLKKTLLALLSLEVFGQLMTTE